jgi:hypothetical protein
MPSSYYIGEQLSKDLIKFCLQMVSLGVFGRNELADAAEDRFGPHADTPGLARKTKRIISYLKYRGYIDEDLRQLKITDKGVERLEKMHMQNLANFDHQWDGKWRILTFDIPEDRRPARSALRRLIKQMGFQPLHKSVWVHPLPCRENIQQIKDAYGVAEHITLLEVTSFDQEPEFRQIFHKITQ